MSFNLIITRHPDPTPINERLPYHDSLLSIDHVDDTLRIKALVANAELAVHARQAGIVAHLHDVTYVVAVPSDQVIAIVTGEGNDRIYVEALPESTVMIESAAGNDDIRVEGKQGGDSATPATGSVTINTGRGNDRVVTVELARASIDTGPGDDFIYSAARDNQIDAGSGYDTLVLAGGNATLAGLDMSHAFPLGDRVYGMATDGAGQQAATPLTGKVKPEEHKRPVDLPPAAPTPMPSDYVETFNIHGDNDYQDRVRHQLDQLRSSPVASVLLHELVKRQVRIAIHYTPELQNAAAEYNAQSGDPRIRNGHRGDRVLDIQIYYNPSAHRPDTPAIVMLYHELCHAWNFATGSVFGDSEQTAIGLEETILFDYDDDPRTPDTHTNPPPFNENALRAELGLPLRTSHKE